MTILLAILLIITSNTLSQGSLDISKFSKPDMTGKLWQDFFNSDSLLFVIPDIELSKSDSTIMFACFRGNFIKRESELTFNDFTKKLHIWGRISDFKNWDSFNLPIIQTENGFIYNKLKFEEFGNAIYYLNTKANRLVYVGNSIDAIDPIRRSILGTYQIYIFNDNLITYNGNEFESLYDLEKTRTEYFEYSESKYFVFYYHKSENNEIIGLQLEMDGFIDSLSNYLVSNTENYAKVKFYLYKNIKDLAYLSGMPFPGEMRGVNVNNIAHASSVDKGIIKHEATHWFIKQKIGDNNNQFYVEGFRQYTEYLFDSTKYQTDLSITKSNMDLITVELIEGNSYVFFASPHNYPISGVFVKYLVDKVGFESFKSIYGSDMINEYFMNEFNMDKSALISEFINKIHK